MINTRKILAGFLVLSILVLCLIWPIPSNQIHFHRNGLIYTIIPVSLWLFFSSPETKKNLNLRKIRLIFNITLILTIFILINGFFVSPDIKKMLFSWNGQWFRPVLLFFTGVIILPTIHSYFSSISMERFFTLIVLSFWGVVCLHFFHSIFLYWHDSTIHWGETYIVYNRTRMSFQINMITGFLLADLLARYFLNRCFLQFNTLFLTIMLFCNLACTILVNTRWGTACLISSLFFIFFLSSLHGIRGKNVVVYSGILIGILVITMFLGYISHTTDSRWNSLISDAISGWKAPINSFCYIQSDPVIPSNNLGRLINHSNGCRASFFHQGWKIIKNHPAGIGPRKEAFRYALQHDFHNEKITISHSHYGLIEFGIQNGIIGIIGWFILLISHWYIGWREFRYGNIIVGMFLLLFTIDFFLRSIVDHNLKDHYIEQYMFLTGLLNGMCALCVKSNAILYYNRDY